LIRRFPRQRRKRSALRRNVFLVRPSIGQSLANDALSQLLGAVTVVNAKRNAVVIAEIEFRQITVQVLFAAILIGAAHTAF
jgi:hypothetical protein